jgi:hypothetical protein
MQTFLDVERDYTVLRGVRTISSSPTSELVLAMAGFSRALPAVE